MLTFVSARSQKWQPGYFMDIKNNKVPGLLQLGGGGKGPIKNEGFIIYKDNAKANEIKLSASDLKYFVMGKDSFIVAHPPSYESWSQELDFVRVELDEPLKLYVYGGGASRGSGGGGFKVRPSISTGFGTGFGGYGGGGIGIGIGSGGGGGGYSKGATYYFGESASQITQVTPMNFKDVMSDIMADEPQAVELIQGGKTNLDHMQSLIKYYRDLKALHAKENN
ncbi:hypothetical protein LLH06_12115 [Mucilaginibacter daejeonensis]|uniref:hypothetical protein n=1 Tax=Mucilaginibacter daejeonensis TaxID=398049 RepID=UPI001D171276|nr:hypothetical protein [Mucilaginibacter daejeonensis]UEG51709.1 hypothetical protein LLH06_12115 [Mucilaginibacter daejeonensis]